MTEEQPGAEPAVEAEEPVEEQEAGLARLTDRFFAYCIDVFLFLIPARLTVGFASALRPIPLDAEFRWQMGWVGAFTLYCAIFNADGRSTLGKKLMGLRVVTLDGDPLSFVRSLSRAIGYIPSGALLELGFLWAFLNPMKRAWHDYMAGSIVVESEDRGTIFRVFTAILSVLMFAGLLFFDVKAYLDQPKSESARVAKESLSYVADLEQAYHQRTGQYTDDVRELAALAGGAGPFRDQLLKTLQPGGFGVRLTRRGYVIMAVAQDGSPVYLRGP